MPIDGVTRAAGYAQLNGRYESDDDGVGDNDIDGANVSPDRLNLAASYARGALSAGVQTQFYLSRRFEGADPRNDFEGYTLTDAVVRYQTDFGGVSLAVQNLFDEQSIS